MVAMSERIDSLQLVPDIAAGHISQQLQVSPRLQLPLVPERFCSVLDYASTVYTLLSAACREDHLQHTQTVSTPHTMHVCADALDADSQACSGGTRAHRAPTGLLPAGADEAPGASEPPAAAAVQRPAERRSPHCAGRGGAAASAIRAAQQCLVRSQCAADGRVRRGRSSCCCLLVGRQQTVRRRDSRGYDSSSARHSLPNGLCA